MPDQIHEPADARRHECTAIEGTSAERTPTLAADEAQRATFVPPTIRELGGLSDLTLGSGSGSGSCGSGSA